MELKYTIHRNNPGTHSKKVEVDGEEAEVIQNKIIAELVPDDGVSGTIKLVLPASADFKYPTGTKISVSFTAAEEKKEEKVS